ncbi:MAG: dipeptide epimerase [Clostridiales bacterium]|nr:dipeptide epimerase [Clostridiales bacterium]
MKITDIRVGKVSIPLKKPFKTALRTVTKAEDIIAVVETDAGEAGYGEAPPTAVITGDTIGSIKWVIEDNIKKAIVGMDIDDMEGIMSRIDGAAVKNSSAKACIDMAIYDLFCKAHKIPLYKLLGGAGNVIETDITVSVNSPDEMAKDAVDYVKAGFNILKVKVGNDSKLDVERLKAVRSAVGGNIKIRADANQGWQSKEAVRTIRTFEDLGLDIELIEQPVKAYDIEGLKFVTENVETPVLADESVFSPYDAFRILSMRAADLINIKLMKAGGIHNALKINAMAEANGIECMIGCMIESKLGVTAAAHLGAGKRNITRADLDPVILLAKDPVVGGARFSGSKIMLGDEPGLGIKEIKGIEFGDG